MRTAYIPKKRDFARLQRYADKQRTLYNRHYLDLRNTFFAHRERVDLAAAFANANERGGCWYFRISCQVPCGNYS
jgi:hypothetical protein